MMISAISDISLRGFQKLSSLSQNPVGVVGVREVDVVFSFFVVGTRKIYFVMNLIVQNLTDLAVTPTGV